MTAGLGCARGEYISAGLANTNSANTALLCCPPLLFWWLLLMVHGFISVLSFGGCCASWMFCYLCSVKTSVIKCLGKS